MSELGKLFDKHGSDKARKHHYDEVYERLFKDLKDKEFNFLEIGVWKGSSTKAFAEYFPNAQIYGMDIFVRESLESIDTNKWPNIFLYEGNSFNKEDADVFRGVHQFDVILDDGAHFPEANETTFKNFHDLLAPGGMYIIEDVWPLEQLTVEEMNHPWLKKYPERYNQSSNEKFLKTLHESGLTLTRYDLRKRSKEPDSHLIVLRK